jgi:hypothetical protein
MNAAKRDHSGVFRPQASAARGNRKGKKAVHISANGVTFLTPTYMAPFTEVQVQLRSAKSASPIQCSGVVVDCWSNGTADCYTVSVAFVNVPRNAEHELRQSAKPSSNHIFLTQAPRTSRPQS